MLDRPARASNWKSAKLAPPHDFDDVEFVEWDGEAAYRRARQKWLEDIQLQGDVGFANMYVVCARLANGYMSFKNDGAAWPGHEIIAADLDWSVPTVRRAIDLAVAWGWLRKFRRPNNSNVYRMAFSRSNRDVVLQYHAERVERCKHASAQKKALADQSGSIKPDHTECSNLINRDDQVRSPGRITPDQLTSLRTSTTYPADRTDADPLGEGEQDMASADGQKKRPGMM